MKTTIYLIIFIILTEIFPIPAINIKFTNLECNAVDKEFVQIPLCRLKVVSRNKVTVNFHLKLLKLPLQNVTVWGQLLRKSHEYRPFLYNSTADLCKFLKNANRFLFWKILWDITKPFTNANHTCPYNHDLIVKNLFLDERNMRLILFPPGEYLLRVYLLSLAKMRININGYFSIKEY